MPPLPGRSTPDLARNAANDGGRDSHEVEWQLAASDLGVVRDWLGRHAVLEGLTIEPLHAQQLHDTYLDTEDWRVFRAGYALRLRESAGRAEATLKALRSARDGVADRRELTEPIAEGRAKALAGATGVVGSRVHDVVGVKPLRKLFEVRTSRERFAVRSRESAVDLGELALDEARFSRARGQRHPTTLTRVELEAIGPLDPALEQLAAQLRTECGLQPASQNKFAAGLHSASLEPPRITALNPKGKPVYAAIDASLRTADFGTAALRRLVGEWEAQLPAARLGERPEALHALRITGRRMDTVLTLFRPYLPAALGKTRPKLKRLLAALGAVRDADIGLEMAHRFRDGLQEAERHALEPLLRHLASERAEARQRMLRALDAKATCDWLETLPARLARPARAATSASRGPAAALAVPDLIRGRYRKLRKCARGLTPEAPLSRYHEVRVRTKKLRYALELVAPTYGAAADEMIAALLELQGRLGTQHDSDVLAGYLTQLAVHPPAEFTAQTLFLMGRLAQLQAKKAARMGGRIEKPWRQVRGKRWKALRARMKKLCNASDSGPETNRGENGTARITRGVSQLEGVLGAAASAGSRGP